MEERRMREKPHTEGTEYTEFFGTQRRAGARGESTERAEEDEEGEGAFMPHTEVTETQSF